jgi:hypothetical protein
MPPAQVYYSHVAELTEHDWIQVDVAIKIESYYVKGEF